MRGEAGGRSRTLARQPQRGSMDVNEGYWMPAPLGEPLEPASFGSGGLTPAEQAVLRRLRRGTRRKAVRAASGIRHRAALRRRRRALAALGPHDLRSLLQIVIELGL